MEIMKVKRVVQDLTGSDKDTAREGVTRQVVRTRAHWIVM